MAPPVSDRHAGPVTGTTAPALRSLPRDKANCGVIAAGAAHPTVASVTSYFREHFLRPARTAPVPGGAGIASTRGLLPPAATPRTTPALAPAVRRVDDKGRIHHPPLAALCGWGAERRCDVTVVGPYLVVTPTDRAGRERGTYDGKARLRLPQARLKAIGLCPGEDAAVLCDSVTGGVTIAPAAALADAFIALGELDDLRAQLSELTAERDAATDRAATAEGRAAVLTDLITHRLADIPSGPLLSHLAPTA